MTEAQQGNENLETTQEQVVEDAYVTISIVLKKTEVPVTSSSRSSDLVSKFLNFLDIPQTDAEIVSPLDVHVHHEVPRTQTPTLLTILVSVIPKSSPVFTNIPQSTHIFTPTPIQATPTPPPTIKTKNPLSNLPNFSSVFRFLFPKRIDLTLENAMEESLHDDFYRFKIEKKKRFKLPWKSSKISFRFSQEYLVVTLMLFLLKKTLYLLFTRSQAQSLSGKTSGLDKLCLSRAQILWGMYHQKNVDYVELLWEDFTYQIDNKVYKKQEKMYYPRFTKVIIHHFLIQEKSLSWRNRIGMHTSKDDYLINTLRFVSRREASQIYGAVLPECLTSPEMKESKAYKTYLGYATGEVPPKVARKFKKASPSKKESELVPGDEEPVKKGKRLKTPAKKSASKPATGIVIREPPVETKSKRKEKEKVDVAHGKGIELLSEVALSEKAQMKEARMKSLRDFHKTHPSGSGTVAEKPPSVEKITPTVTSEGTGDKPGVPDVTNDDSSESESESWGNDEDDSNNEQESSDESSKQENESEEQELG
ncbi:hypothetical protein Tco_1010237 [Tanacetum coccineum]